MAFIKSNKIKVFPSAFRGKDKLGKQYDIQSYLTTEYNLTNITNKLTCNDSFIVDYDKLGGVGSASKTVFVLGGYLFDVEGIESEIERLDSISEIWASIKIKDIEGYKTLTSFNNDTILDDAEYFKGLSFTYEKPIDASYYLKLFTVRDRELIPCKESFITFTTKQIKDESSGKSIEDEITSKKFRGHLVWNSDTATNFDSLRESTLGNTLENGSDIGFASSSVNNGKYNFGNLKINEAAITNEKIANDAIDSNKIADDSIKKEHIHSDVIDISSSESNGIKANLSQNSDGSIKVNVSSDLVNKSQNDELGQNIKDNYIKSVSLKSETSDTIKVIKGNSKSTEFIISDVAHAKSTKNVDELINNDSGINANVNFAIGNKSYSKIITNVSRAVGDESGNNIKNTYATKSELSSGLETKQPVGSYVSSSEFNELKESTSIESMKKIFLDSIYPIGSIYISYNNVSPQTFLGGKWTSIRGKFLFAEDGELNTSIGNEGGEKTHKLTLSEMPKHDHKGSIDSGEVVSYGASGYSVKYGSTYDIQWKESPGTNKYLEGGHGGGMLKPNSKDSYKTTNIAPSGSDMAHNNMPPYLAVYMWRRIS